MPRILVKKYETDENKIYQVRVEGTFAVQAVIGTPPEGAVTDRNVLVKRSRNSKEPGISPRHALFTRSIGTAAGENDKYVTQGKAYKMIPVLTKAKFAELNTTPPGDIVIDNATFKFLALVDEKRRKV